MKRQFYGGIGSVSSGTMLESDLIPSFVWEAKHLRLTRAERVAVSRIDRESNADGYFESEEAGYDLEELFNILDAHSLPYFSFSAHEGDGADYGWWLSSSFADDFDGLKINDLSEMPKGYTGEMAVINDHGNVTLYGVKRGRTHEVWAIV